MGIRDRIRAAAITREARGALADHVDDPTGTGTRERAATGHRLQQELRLAQRQAAAIREGHQG